MKAVSGSFTDAIASEMLQTSLESIFYFKVPLPILSVASGTITLLGDATGIISEGDYCLIGLRSFKDPYIVSSIAFGSGATVIVFTDNGNGVSFVTPPNYMFNLFVFVKIDLTNFLMRNSVSKISESFDSGSLMDYSIGSVYLGLYNIGNTLFNLSASRKTGLFLKESSQVVITEVGATYIEFSTTDFDVDINLLCGVKIQVLTGKARNTSYISLHAEYNSSYTRLNFYTNQNDPYTDAVVLGDSVKLSISPEAVIHLRMRPKAVVPSEDDWIIPFIGFMRAEQVDINTFENSVKIQATSLLAELEKDKAYHLSDEADFLNNVPGIKILHYTKGAVPFENYGVKEVAYNFPAFRSISGINIREVSYKASYGVYLLQFKHPNYFKFGGGAWSKKERDSIDTDTTYFQLTASDGTIITCDFRYLDYPAFSIDDIVFVSLDDKFKLDISNIGVPSISIDSNNRVPALLRFNQIAYNAAGEVGPTVDVSDLYNESSLVYLEDAKDSFFLGLSSKFFGIYFEGILNDHNPGTSLSLEFFISSSNDSWISLDAKIIKDTTSNLKNDGFILWSAPNNWLSRQGIVAATDSKLYFVKIHETTGAANLSIGKIIPINFCYGSFGDIYYFSCDYEKVILGEISDSMIIRKDLSSLVKTTIAASWKSNERLVDLITDLVDLSSFYDPNANSLPASKVLLPTGTMGINTLGKVPKYAYSKRTITFALSPLSSKYIFMGVENELWRMSEDSSFVKIYSIPIEYNIYSIVIPTTGTTLMLYCLKRIYPENTLDKSKTFESSTYFVVIISSYDAEDISSMTFLTEQGSALYPSRYPDTFLRFGVNYAQQTGPGAAPFQFKFYLGNANYTDPAVIPFNQSLVPVFYDTHYAPPADENVLIYASVKSFWDSLFDVNETPTLAPQRVVDGFYQAISEAWFMTAVTYESQLRLRYSLGQKKFKLMPSWGGALVLFSGGADSYINYLGILSQNGSSTSMKRVSTFMGLNTYAIHEANTYNRWFADIDSFIRYYLDPIYYFQQTFWLLGSSEAAAVIGSNYKEIIASIHSDCPFQFYSYGGNSHLRKPAENYLELFIPDDTIGLTSTYIWHYDKSANTWYNVTTDVGIRVDHEDDIYICNAASRFSKVALKGTGFSSYNICAGAKILRADMASFNNVVSFMSSELISSSCIVFSHAIYSRWTKVPIGGSGISSKLSSPCYVMKLEHFSGSYTFSSIKIHSYELWSSNYLSTLEVAETSRRAWAVLDFTYNPNNDRLYGCVLDRASLEYYIFYIPLSSARGGSFSNEMVILSLDLDFEMQYEDFIYNSIDNRVYFVATDKRYQQKTCVLYSISDLTTRLESYLMPGMWDSISLEFNLDSPGSIYGIVGNKTSYFLWQYSNSFFIRILIANFEDKSIRAVLSELSLLQALYVYVSSEGVLTVGSRDYFSGVSYAGQPVLTAKDIEKISSFDDYKHIYECVVVNFSDGDSASNVIIGNPLSDKKLTISNSFIQDRFLAKFVCEELMNLFCYYVKEMQIDTRFHIEMEVFDFVRIRAKNEFYPFPDTKLWMIIGFDLDFNNSSLSFKIIDKGQ